MVKVWYIDDEPTDQKLEHLSPPVFLDLDELFKKTGVEYFQIDPENDALLSEIRKDRNYSYEDQITCSKECLPDYENTMKVFYTEHLHKDDEIRFIVGGSGYFDVRDGDDKWIRIAASYGDMIIMPAGIYHRFTLDSNNYIKAKRYFVGGPIWTAYNRPADDMDCRKEYLKRQANGFVQLGKA